MTDWINAAVDRAKQRYSNQRIEDEKNTNLQKLKTTKGKEFWSDSKRFIIELVKEFNEKYGDPWALSHREEGTMFVVTAAFSSKNKLQASLLYKEQETTVLWSKASKDQKAVSLIFNASQDGQVELREPVSGKTIANPTSLAENFMAELLA